VVGREQSDLSIALRRVGSGPNDVWAVGWDGTILHFDGAAWSSMPSGTTDPLQAVRGTAANDVWIVGQGGSILHWDGATWSKAKGGGETSLTGLAVASQHAWAMSLTGTILHHVP